MGPQAAADGGQLGGLAPDDREVGVLVEVEVAPVVDLLHLPFADQVGRAADQRQARVDSSEAARWKACVKR